MDAGLTGQVSLSEVATLLQALAVQARVTEAEELAARIEALEEKLGVPNDDKSHSYPT
jgi:BMFP domain-containing protein YqiC